jgi:hypothetical protein
MENGKEKVELLEQIVKEQLQQMETMKQKVPIVEATVVDSSGSNDPMAQSVTSPVMDASWQLADPAVTAGVLLNEQQAQVFLPGSAYSGGESGVAEESNVVDFGEASPISAHDTSPGSPNTPVSSPAERSPRVEEGATTPRSSASALAARAYNAIVGKKEKKDKK